MEHLRIRLSNGTAASFNTGDNQQIAEQKETALLATALAMRHRNQIEEQKLSIAGNQIGYSFDDTLFIVCNDYIV